MTWIDEADPAHLMCRDTGIRHRWEPKDVERVTAGFLETLECERCGCTKERKLTRTGAPRGGVKFYYPDGYVRVGEGRMTKKENAAIRLSSLKKRYSL